MQICAHCGKTDTTAGKWDGALRYCSQECLAAGPGGRFAIQISREELEREVSTVHQGRCPACGGAGPVDIHTSYWVYSPLIVTFWNSSPRLCCAPCGMRALRKHTLRSLLFGWWGIPIGPIVTAMELFRNFRAMFRPPDRSRPSRELIQAVGSRLTQQATHTVVASYGRPASQS
jgi:hypothetical protein